MLLLLLIGDFRSQEREELAECGHRLSRLAALVNSQRVRYRRAAAYLVADLMASLHRHSLYPAVRHQLTLVCLSLLIFCHPHSQFVTDCLLWPVDQSTTGFFVRLSSPHLVPPSPPVSLQHPLGPHSGCCVFWILVSWD